MNLPTMPAFHRLCLALAATTLVAGPAQAAYFYCASTKEQSYYHTGVFEATDTAAARQRMRDALAARGVRGAEYTCATEDQHPAAQAGSDRTAGYARFQGYSVVAVDPTVVSPETAQRLQREDALRKQASAQQADMDAEVGRRVQAALAAPVPASKGRSAAAKPQ